MFKKALFFIFWTRFGKTNLNKSVSNHIYGPQSCSSSGLGVGKYLYVKHSGVHIPLRTFVF